MNVGKKEKSSFTNKLKEKNIHIDKPQKICKIKSEHFLNYDTMKKKHTYVIYTLHEIITSKQRN